MPTVRRFRMTINGKVYEVEAEEIGSGQAVASSAPAPAPAVTAPPAPPRPEAPKVEVPAKKTPVGGAAVEAPLPGVVLDVKVTSGQAVTEGQVLVILEAMKMENEIVAPHAGTVSDIAVQKGASVSAGDVLVVLA